MAFRSPPVISQRSPGNPIRPRKWRVLGDAVEPAPDGEQHIAQHVGGVIRSDTPTQVTLKWLVHLGGDELEALPPLDVRVHWRFLSAITPILSSAAVVVRSFGPGSSKFGSDQVETEQERANRQERERKESGEKDEAERKESAEKHDRERREESERYERERQGE